MLKLTKLALIATIALTAACTEEKKPEAVTVPAPAPAPTPAPIPAPAPPPAPAAAAPTAINAAAEAEAATIFGTRCAACHGADGKGDGVAAAALNPKPRAYSDKAWQASVDDNHIARVIVEGGAAVGKSPMMAPNPDLKDKPDVVKALVAKIRSYNK
jgi:mono/diheme cytochrome c family protein